MRSFLFLKNIELTTPRFLRIKKLIIGIMIDKIKMGKILPVLSCMGVYFGVTKKYDMVPAIAIKIG
jgi:hypothetical protein